MVVHTVKQTEQLQKKPHAVELASKTHGGTLVQQCSQMVKVLVEVDDEKEIRDYSVDQLKFKPKRRRDHVKLTAQELKELSALEDKGGKSKIDDAK